MPALLVGIHGLARHGKGSVNKFMSDKLRSMGYTVSDMSFSPTIHKACAEYVSKDYGIPYDEAYTWMSQDEFKDTYNEVIRMSPRKYMQNYGESERKKHGLDIFVKRTLENLPDVDFVLCDSIRIDEEAAAFKNGGDSILINVFNPGMPQSTDNHATEQGISLESDIYLLNDYIEGVPGSGCSLKVSCESVVENNIVPFMDSCLGSHDMR